MVNPFKKYVFRRQSWRKWPRITRKMYSWRKPKGLHSKVRKKLKGYLKMPDPGYGAPRELRYLHPCGLLDVLVHNVKELDNLDPEKHLIRIASAVGMKKKLEIYREAIKRGFRVANPPKLKGVCHAESEAAEKASS